jgi:hypothetical protein
VHQHKLLLETRIDGMMSPTAMVVVLGQAAALSAAAKVAVMRCVDAPAIKRRADHLNPNPNPNPNPKLS